MNEATQIGQWVLMLVMLVPAAKVLHDWVRPPHTNILPQPLNIKFADQFATKGELQKLDTDLQNQVKDLRAYMHNSMHDIKSELQNHWLKADSQREKLFETIGREGRRVDSRINEVLVKVTDLGGRFDQSQRRHHPDDR